MDQELYALFYKSVLYITNQNFHSLIMTCNDLINSVHRMHMGRIGEETIMVVF